MGNADAAWSGGGVALKVFLGIVLFIVVLPPVGVGWGIYIIVTRHRRHGAWLLAAAAAFAMSATVLVNAWHPTYINLRYYTRLPPGETLNQPKVYQAKLVETGFTNVSVVLDRGPGETECHSTDHVEAYRDPKHNDLVRTDSPVVIHVGCW